MTIPSSDLKWYKSETVTDTSANGGKMSEVEIIGGVKNNIFPDVSQAERQSGLIRYRKIFAKNKNALNEILINPLVHMKDFTPGQDYVEVFLGTQVDTQGTWPTGDTAQKYGAGKLNTDVSAGVPGGDIEVLLEEATQDIFPTASAFTMWISDGVNQEYHHNVTASSPVSGVVTITLDATDQLSNNYIASDTFVASVIYQPVTNLHAYADSVTVTSGISGTYDDTNFPIEGDNDGAVEDTITLTFTDGTNFTAAMSDGTPITSGNISTDFQPLHPVSGKTMFILRIGGWGGSFQAGDTVDIPLHPSSIPVWLKQTVPAGSNSFSGNNFNIRFGGESA